MEQCDISELEAISLLYEKQKDEEELDAMMAEPIHIDWRKYETLLHLENCWKPMEPVENNDEEVF